MVKPTTLIVSGMVCVSISIGLLFYAFPKLLKWKIADVKELRKNNQMRKDWENIPMALDFKIFIFNVTNPDEVSKGGKPTVKEVGPYFYREWKSKVNPLDLQEDDTVTYQLFNTWYFDRKETKPLTGNEVIILPHMLILAFAELIRQLKPGALNVLNKAIPHIFDNPSSVFLKTTPRELLFDGVTINCTKSKEFAVNMLCDKIRDDPSGLLPQDDGTFKFSLFGSKNATPDVNTITVKRGTQNIQEVGEVVKYNGKTEMDYWDGMPCNQIKGSDTTMYPPFMEGTGDIWNFGAEICRALPVQFKEYRDFKGIHTLYYEGDLGDMSSDADLKCFCPMNTTGYCLKKGVMDAQRCFGAPIILSLPHCYLCDSEYLNSVSGLEPNHEKHIFFAYFEPITGTPVNGRRRLQFNMWLQQFQRITIMKTLPEKPVLMPLIWVEEGLALNDSLAKMVRTMLYTPTRVVNVTKILLLLLGVILIGAGIFMFYQHSKLNEGATTTQVSPTY